MTNPREPGYVVLSVHSDKVALRSELASLVSGLGDGPTESRSQSASLQFITWGLPESSSGTGTFALVRGPRMGNTDLSGEAIHELLQQRPPAGVAEALPPFAAIEVSDHSAIAITDAIGARHVYVSTGDDWAATSTSPHLLALLRGPVLDREALAVQSQLGWQLGRRTWYRGVTKIDAGTSVVLLDGEMTERRYSPPVTRATPQGDEIQAAAAFLREYMTAYLDEHPASILQLTGGQDSRILLSAIPRERRHQVAAMTLGVPGSQDVAIASDLAARSGMSHQVVSLDGLASLDPDDVWERCRLAAIRLGCMADPLAMATLAYAEAKIEQGPRISGLGGEVARGFYYMGPPVKLPVTRLTSDLLAKWRMLTNQRVAQQALEPEFARWATAFTLDEIHRSLRATGLDWMAASDHFYLYERMQRWAGVTDTAVCFDREVTNPMLDRRFLDIAQRVAPAQKRNARFLAKLQVELDPELANVPLDRRPTPRQMAATGLGSTARSLATTGRKASRKVRQRISHAGRPAAGTDILAARVVEHWREQPHVLGPAASSGVLAPGWIDGVVDSSIDPDPATVAFVINLVVAENTGRATSPGSRTVGKP